MIEQPLSLRFVCARCGALYVDHMERCWHGCSESGFIIPRAFRPASYLRPRPGGTTAKELARLRQKKFELSSLPGLKLANGTVVIAGPPGCGKSTMGLHILAELRPSVLFSFEESLSETLADRIRRLEMRYDDLFIEVPQTVRQAYEVLDSLRPRAVMIDSLRASTFTIQDMTAMAEGYGLVVIVIQHLTKAGQVGGASDIPYDADVVIRLEKGGWELTKSRFQPLAEGKIKGVA